MTTTGTDRLAAPTSPRAGAFAERISAVRERAWAPVDPASLSAFRVALGGLLAVASLRFLQRGWVTEHFVEPAHFFPYWGFEWVKPGSSAVMHAVYVVMAIAALGVAAGALYRASAAVLFVLFTYAHLCDKTHYLNHYYLVSLLTGLAVLLPLHHHHSVDSWWQARRDRVPGTARGDAQLPWPPTWILWLVQFQIGVVYFFGGAAKLGPDWMAHALPLRIWLLRSTDLPVIGWLFRHQSTAYAMSWAGAAFDLSIPFLLTARKTRTIAFLAVLGFHAMVGSLFQLGMFPFFMPAFATIFFDPSWPRRLWGRWRSGTSEVASRSTGAREPGHWQLGYRWGFRFAIAYCALQIALPLRHLAYPGSVLWTEEGFRFAWKVMLIEKNGVVTAQAVDRSTGERFYVAPRDYLTPLQERMMSTQPDMILQFAHMVRDDFRARGRDVEVFVDARVSLNGRPSRPLIDPTVDLAREEEGFGAKKWVLPMPTDPPRF